MQVKCGNCVFYMQLTSLRTFPLIVSYRKTLSGTGENERAIVYRDDKNLGQTHCHSVLLSFRRNKFVQ